MDKRLRFMRDLIKPMRIAPGSTVRLSRDHDPAATGPVPRLAVRLMTLGNPASCAGRGRGAAAVMRVEAVASVGCVIRGVEEYTTVFSTARGLKVTVRPGWDWPGRAQT
jgi:hypothetical protein